MGVSERLAHLINMHNNTMFMYFTVLRFKQTGSWPGEEIWSRRGEDCVTPLSSSVFGRLHLTGQHTSSADLDNTLKHRGNYVYHQLWYSKKYAFLYCVCMSFLWLYKQTGIILQQCANLEWRWLARSDCSVRHASLSTPAHPYVSRPSSRTVRGET